MWVEDALFKELRWSGASGRPNAVQKKTQTFQQPVGKDVEKGGGAAWRGQEICCGVLTRSQ